MPQLDSFAAKDLSLLPPALLAAVEQAPLPDLLEGPRVAGLAKRLLDDTESAWSAIAPQQRPLCRSGLWLAAGDLDRSHSISQDIGSAEGSFWHAIMHRREGDFSNAKYWFGKVGQHPVLAQLAQLSEGTYADPFDFVDACARVKRNDDPSYQQCQRNQWLEWQALMVHCIVM